MLHIGVVFVVFGIFLLGAGLIPGKSHRNLLMARI